MKKKLLLIFAVAMLTIAMTAISASASDPAPAPGSPEALEAIISEGGETMIAGVTTLVGALVPMVLTIGVIGLAIYGSFLLVRIVKRALGSASAGN
jgi:hypothetical protein